MLTELTTQHKVTGAKQVTRALKNAKALRVFMAQDADPRVTEPIQDLCEDLGVDIEEVETMAQLGQAWRHCRGVRCGGFGGITPKQEVFSIFPA